MTDTYIVRLNGQEVARISGSGLAFAQHVDRKQGEIIEDQKLLKCIQANCSVFIVMASSQKSVTIEKAASASI